MKVQSLKLLFSAAFLGLMLAGCSSTPTAEGDAEAANQEVMDKTVVETSVADQSSAKSTDLNDMQAKLAGMVVRFDFDRSEVKSEFFDVIKANAEYMMADSSAKVTVSGHCDERGTREYNLALGERRANAVKDALIAEGVSADRITVISYGEDNPVAEGHNEAAWSQNRRAEFSY
ncbi:peptidoglycan-associated lipoprotein Pal [Thiomicrorhabdus sp. ZW0627]|uniref:peptidoglycan-associated lipoprotein Pal n=1 Tax=Thiomicrorhabdus sp. ZW0627 TaxID=3039774 RepID=UPI00243732E9|nr:peptidoglycan-associated lipoprotein Pal [Thiomicrorhabdus sp. ZW0627]MDG6773391.1 peptidoglycan-associated lipoprotein Pal [Thiomicrorhabdus sp. ZW0627]